MSYYKRILLVVVACLLTTYTCAQTQPCPSGTLANVLGTSCSIGNVTYTFNSNFSGFHQIDDATNTLQTTSLTPDVIGFVPVTTATQSGFTLVANFDETTDAFTQPFSDSDISFSYAVQVNGSFEITDETATIAGSVTQDFFEAVISSFDAHSFGNNGFLQVGPQIAFLPNGLGFNSTPSVTFSLPVPGLASTTPNPGGLPFTTQLTAFAFQGDRAQLNSATFLYTVAPQLPLPPLANLAYTNIDVPGSLTSTVEGMNDAGDTVGFFTDSTGRHPFMQDETGVHTLSFPAGTAGTPLAINNRRDIVGQVSDASRHTHGFLLHDGVLSLLDFPGSILTIAAGINDHGEITGLFQPNRFSVHGFHLDANGFTVIDNPGARSPGFTETIGINNRGDIAGFFIDQSARDSAFILSGGAFQAVPVPGGFSPFLEGLNDHEVAVGGYRDLHGIGHGFVTDRGTVATVDFPGARSTTALQIDSPGRILGRYIDTAGHAHSFLAVPAPANGLLQQPLDTSNVQSPVRACTADDQLEDRQDVKDENSCPAN